MEPYSKRMAAQGLPGKEGHERQMGTKKNRGDDSFTGKLIRMTRGTLGERSGKLGDSDKRETDNRSVITFYSAGNRKGDRSKKKKEGSPRGKDRQKPTTTMGGKDRDVVKGTHKILALTKGRTKKKK